MRRFFPLALLLLALPAAAQPQQVLFPDLTGDALRAALRAAYRPASITGDNDDLYNVIDRTNVGGQDGVVCVYTGFFVPFDCVPSCDFSQDVFNDGAGINQEHTWPQSLLSGLAIDDLHNLFPTRVNVNADRGNLRFAELPDTQTSRWYRNAKILTTPPPEPERDEYSELLTNVSFEPREVHEGNVARALFYMDTVYDTQTSSAFPFDLTQRRLLYEWHRLDPIDQAEYDRTFRIAPFQRSGGGAALPNPFVLDSTLIRRAYPEVSPVGVEGGVPEAPRLTAGPNPFRAEAVVRLVLGQPGPARVEVFDALGRRAARLHDGLLPAGETVLSLDGRGLAPGLYVVRVTAGAWASALRLARLP